MSTSIPPELMPPVEREARAAELERQIAREWLLFAIADGLLLLAAVAVVFVAHGTTGLTEGAFVYAAVIGAIVYGVFALYWVLKRIRPLQVELAALRSRT